MTAKPKPLSVDMIRTDGDTQSRVEINDDTVEDYAGIISSNGKGWPFPPLDVFHDGSDYFVSDGFHRLLGAVRAKRGSVPCNVHKGTATDARIFGMTANDKHGMRMSRADKRACVEYLLDHGSKMTQADIAEKAGVSKRTVSMIVADRKPPVAPKPKAPPGGGENAQIAPSPPQSGGKGGAATDSEPETDTPAATRRPSKKKATKPDLGKCPNCAGAKWTKQDDGWVCSKCSHPHGEPTGGADEDRVATQRSKTVKTAEALMRAFDDLQTMLAKPEHGKAIKSCKELLAIAKSWK